VLLEAQAGLLNYDNTGLGVMEMSHRSPAFEGILARAERDCRALLGIPDSYRVLFLQGGGSTQFSAVPLNLCPTADTKAHYLVTGSWSQAAAQEASKYARTNVVTPAGAPKGSFTTLPALEQVQELLQHEDSEQAAYVYACHNETVHGVEWGSELESLFEPETEGAAPHKPYLVSDMSSSFMSRPVDVRRFGLIYAGAQKNVGPAGLTLVIVRDSLLHGAHATKPQACTPLMLQYALQAEKQSMYNTPPCWSIYVTGLVFQYLLRQGGLQAVGEANAAKAAALYAAIDNSPGGFYRAFVQGPQRSRMNVVFTVVAREADGSASQTKRDDAANAAFVTAAEARGLVGLAGHRSVGGLRASLYNAVGMDSVQALIAFMEEFQRTYTADKSAAAGK